MATIQKKSYLYELEYFHYNTQFCEMFWIHRVINVAPLKIHTLLPQQALCHSTYKLFLILPSAVYSPNGYRLYTFRVLSSTIHSALPGIEIISSSEQMCDKCINPSQSNPRQYGLVPICYHLQDHKLMMTLGCIH